MRPEVVVCDAGVVEPAPAPHTPHQATGFYTKQDDREGGHIVGAAFWMPSEVEAEEFIQQARVFATDCGVGTSRTLKYPMKIANVEVSDPLAGENIVTITYGTTTSALKRYVNYTQSGRWVYRTIERTATDYYRDNVDHYTSIMMDKS